MRRLTLGLALGAFLALGLAGSAQAVSTESTWSVVATGTDAGGAKGAPAPFSGDWQLTAQTPSHVVLRLMERGDFVAQATLTPWPAAEKGKHLTPDEFRAAMEETPGWEPEEELQASEVPLEGMWVYRLSSAGKLDGLKVTQNFYLVAGPNGDQVVLTFTMTPAQVVKLGTRDVNMVGSVAFPARK